ncbi:type II toxin-antitoxin system HicA family toxin [Mucilaginibacter sp. SJ]|uniref:type II toxin-antitoxin system HicA family toxin n=1 Tax=Mucilaginibacter sp. SJ TaxID=3029053 RepID=UPI0023A9D610|nr:type II toxin-antitoxin system HicA family toxin [Mucilaginibacter sp. SJ]WDZ99950.1 type II toxin-antitoxin system HicA family toxin [Mucilaginibacter sp. SJ]
MSRQEKLIARMLSIPKDFTWDELFKILSSFGFEELKGGETGGSRRKFVDANKNIINLHKLHPANILRNTQ